MTHLLIAGHGKRKNGTFDPGATGIIKKGENRYMKEDLFPAMKKFLPKDHILVFFDDYNVYSHGNIVALAKKYNATQITEFHYDAASSSATGGHVIIYDGYKPDKMDLALRDVIKDMVGTIYNHKGHAGISGRSNLANVNRTKSAGITYRLVELGFGTNVNNAKVLTEDVETYAKKLVKTLTGATNDKKTSKPKPSKPTSKPNKKPSKSKGGDSTVRAIQTKLNRYKVNNIKVDGFAGPITYKALIKAYQYELNRQFDAGLVVDGLPGPKTDNAAVIIRYNKEYGNLAHLVQAMLYLQGTSLSVDGYWQDGSIEALKAYQSKNGLKPDGLLGKGTSSKLTRL